MEPIIALVGFLGAGKTTLLKQITEILIQAQWSPYIILNDYENADLDSQFFLNLLGTRNIKAITGSCICCSGVIELRTQVNQIPERPRGVTLIEANGTTDAYALMEFLGVGLKQQFLPPVQIAVVDARLWQKRGIHNELESSQVKVASLIVLNYQHTVTKTRRHDVRQSLFHHNPTADIVEWESLKEMSFINLTPRQEHFPDERIVHAKSHWSSCSVDLPDPLSSKELYRILESLPKNILRVKGCTRLDIDPHYSFFEKTPSAETFIKQYKGTLVSGPKLIAVGPRSDPATLSDLIKCRSLETPQA